MRRLYLILGILILALLLVCSKKSTGPDDNLNPSEIMRASLALQDSVGQRVVEWLAQTDTTAALNSGIELLMDAHKLVDTAIATEQGIAVQFKNGMQGGIMVDPKDGLPINPQPAEHISHPQKISGSRPGSLRTLFLCPIYYDRWEFADSIINSTTQNIQDIGYIPFLKYLGNICDLDKFQNLNGYGLIHIYSHSFSWPELESPKQVYLMTGETVAPQIDSEVASELLENKVSIIYIPGKGNTYFIAPNFITPGISFQNASPLIYLDFGNSYDSSWQSYLVDGIGAGACIGIKGNLDIEHNLDWSNGFYEAMGDTSQIQQNSLAQWYGSIKTSYVNDENQKTEINYSGPDDFSFWKLLVIDELNTYSGKAGETVKIKGRGFGPSDLLGKVFFGTEQASVSYWTDTLIIVTIPKNAVSGDLFIEIGTMTTNKIYFRVHPDFAISEIIPDSAGLRDTIQIFGGGFGDSIGMILIGGFPATGINYWSDTLIITATPASGNPGMVEVKILANDQWMEPFPLKIINTIRLDSIAPNWVRFSDTVSYYGSGFGEENSSYSVLFSATEGFLSSEILLWSDTLVKAVAPNRAISGKTYLSRGIGTSYESNKLDIDIFGILDIDNKYALPGTSITITGTGFGDHQLSNNVHIGNQILDAYQWRDSSIKARLPNTAMSDSIFVLFNNIPSNSVAIHISAVDLVVPSWAVPGSEVILYGGGFGDSLKEAYIDNLPAILNSWSDTEISVDVPLEARAGLIKLRLGDLWINGPELSIFYADSISPSQNIKGGIVKIFGSGFLDDQYTSVVRFGDVEAEVQSWSDSLIRVYVPDIDEDCSVTINVRDYVSSAFPFQITSGELISYMLQQCTYVKASFSGYITERLGGTYDSRYRYYSYFGQNDSLWSGLEFQFGSFCDIGTWSSCRAALGAVNMDGNSVDSVFGQNYFTFNNDMMWELTIWNRSFKLHDLPIISFQDDGPVTIVYELSGPEVQDHISDILIFKTYKYYGPDTLQTAPESYAEEYIDTDWENTEHPPAIRIIFSNQPIP